MYFKIITNKSNFRIFVLPNPLNMLYHCMKFHLMSKKINENKENIKNKQYRDIDLTYRDSTYCALSLYIFL